jgi:6-phosphofructokinase 1
MGRDAGHIALNAGIGAGAEEILNSRRRFRFRPTFRIVAKSKAFWKIFKYCSIAEGDKIGKNVFELKDYIEANLPEYDIRVSVLRSHATWWFSILF